MRILVTGGAGFIGSAVCRHLVGVGGHTVLNFDKLTYAANPASLAPVDRSPLYRFVQGDVTDGRALAAVFEDFGPEAVVHLAAETHVDRSIDGAKPFIDTNIVGVFALLETVRGYLGALPKAEAGAFRLLHVSTDEVFGALGATGYFDETSPYRPNSPYSASKAAADHLIRAWAETHGLPAIISNCSNNFGPCQFPEKLIPLTILNGLEDRPLPVYGRGVNVRDWLYVEDHARALALMLERGQIGETYCVGGGGERTNIEIVEAICDLLDEIAPRRGQLPRRQLIAFVTDRPGHDLRYAIDSRKLREQLGWRPEVGLEDGLRRTVRWYVENPDWWRPARDRYAGERLGRAAPAAARA